MVWTKLCNVCEVNLVHLFIYTMTSDRSSPSGNLWALGGLWAIIAFMVLTQLNLILRVCDGILILSGQAVCDSNRQGALGIRRQRLFMYFMYRSLGD